MRLESCGRRGSVLIGSLTCHVKPEHATEFLDSAGTLLERARRFNGCLGCRIVTEHPDPHAYVLITEWTDRPSFQQFIGSREFHILRGMQILMHDALSMVVDDVVTRARLGE